MWGENGENDGESFLLFCSAVGVVHRDGDGPYCCQRYREQHAQRINGSNGIL
jgi:hypothetical protein